MDISLKKLFWALWLLVFSLLLGTFGFHFIEQFNFLDAFYMSVITLSTVGFTEVHVLTDKGRLFTAFYILLNLGILAYTLAVFSSIILEGKLKSIYKNYMSDLKISKLNQHVIVCGYGRNGEEACKELKRNGRKFVIVEMNEEALKRISPSPDFQVVLGNATTDSILQAAGIDRAAVIITTTSSDADNVFITLTARELNPNIKIIARASEKESESKLYRAGADSVIMPDHLGGMFMAQMVTKPVVIEFLNLMTGFNGQHYHLEQVRYEELKDIYKDKTLKDLQIHEVTGGTVIGLKDKIKGLIPSPSLETLIELEDTIVVLGTVENIKKLKDHFFR
jgi:voltage-gated potassium channel